MTRSVPPASPWSRDSATLEVDPAWLLGPGKLPPPIPTDYVIEVDAAWVWSVRPSRPASGPASGPPSHPPPGDPEIQFGPPPLPHLLPAVIPSIPPFPVLLGTAPAVPPAGATFGALQSTPPRFCLLPTTIETGDGEEP